MGRSAPIGSVCRGGSSRSSPVEKLRERFLSKVKREESGCWVWTAALFSDGYGAFSWDRRNIRAHRAAWLIFRGEIPEQFLVLHGPCHERRCVNPDHLYLGTTFRNSADKVRDGTVLLGDVHPRRLRPGPYAHLCGDGHWSRRSPEKLARGDANGARTKPDRLRRGAEHGMARLSVEQVLEARRLRALGVSFPEIKRRIGSSVNLSALRQAVHGKTWQHLPDAVK